MNVRSVRNKLDYVFDHIFDNDLDIVALTETWLSNEDNNNTHVITECSNHGYTMSLGIPVVLVVVLEY